MSRIAAYVDGLNLYYRALKDTRYKWLNVVKFVNLTLGEGQSIDKLKYFTANVSGVVDPQAPRRQRIYLNALLTLPELSVIYGRFFTKSLIRPLLNIPIANRDIHADGQLLQIPEGNHIVDVGRSRVLPVRPYEPNSEMRKRRRSNDAQRKKALHVQVDSMEEKGSDVNLAVHLLNDAWQDSYDIAVVVSNDTDLVESIRLVTEERKKRVIVLCPARDHKVAAKLGEIASDVKYTRDADLRKAQFPSTLAGGRINKPDAW